MQIMTYARRIFAMFVGTHKIDVQRVVDAGAGTTTAETVVGHAMRAPGNATTSKVHKVYYLPAAALTANDTNYATITVSKYTSAGGSKTTVATATTETTGTDSWTAFEAVEFALSSTAADLILESNAILTYEVAKTAAGVAVPAGKLVVVLGDAY